MTARPAKPPPRFPAVSSRSARRSPEKEHPVFRRSRFLAGAEAAELRWFTPAGAAGNSVTVGPDR